MSDRDELIQRLVAQASIDEPFAGFTDCEGYRTVSPAWPGDDWAEIHRTGVLVSERRDVWLYTFTRAGTEPTVVPVGVVFDKTGEDLRARVYYNKTHFGSSEPRRPVIVPEDELVPDEVARYISAMRSGNREQLLSVVDAGAGFQSPFGPITGTQFIDNFSRPGPGGAVGVPLQVCTVATDGHRHAVEFISWRKPPHGGLGFYEFTDGKLAKMKLFEGPVKR
jgi:hypothetical protein